MHTQTSIDGMRPPKVRFATDAALEGDGFEPSVPRERDGVKVKESISKRSRSKRSNTARAWKRWRSRRLSKGAVPHTGNATAGSRAVGGDCRICLKKSHQLFRFPDLRLDKFLRKHLARPLRVERKGGKERCLSS